MATDGCPSEYPLEQLMDITKFLKNKICLKPKIGIICGFGMSGMVEGVKEKIEVKYEDIPNFPENEQGELDCLIFGRLASVSVVIMTTRFNFYDGYSLNECTMPVRIFKLLGCTGIIVSSSAGGLNPNYKLGDIMIIKADMNFMKEAGTNSLGGPNTGNTCDIFPAMNKYYDRETRRYANKVAENLELGMKVHSGVYTCIRGPSYSAVAQAKVFRNLGTDAIGMSLVPEVIVAKQCGLKVFAFILITDIYCLNFYEKHKRASNEEISQIVENSMKSLQNLLLKVVDFMGVEQPRKCNDKSKLTTGKLFKTDGLITGLTKVGFKALNSKKKRL